MSLIRRVQDWYTEVALGNVPNRTLVHKFGAATIGTTFQPITQSGNYQTPTTGQTLEAISDSTADSAAGTGARKITIIGLDSSWNEQQEEVTLNGTTAVAVSNKFTRVYRVYVSESGSYATQSVGSHSGNITVRGVGGGATWAVIPNTPFPTGQTEIGCYTVPTGYTAYLLSKNVFVDSNKQANVYFFRRDNADDVTTPYGGAMRLVEKEIGVSAGIQIKTASPKGSFVGPCDVGFMGVMVSGTADVSVEFELLLVQN